MEIRTDGNCSTSTGPASETSALGSGSTFSTGSAGAGTTPANSKLKTSGSDFCNASNNRLMFGCSPFPAQQRLAFCRPYRLQPLVHLHQSLDRSPNINVVDALLFNRK